MIQPDPRLQALGAEGIFIEQCFSEENRGIQSISKLQCSPQHPTSRLLLRGGRSSSQTLGGAKKGCQPLL